jgi:hypothetical protein
MVQYIIVSVSDDCDNCFLKQIMKPLLSHFSDAINIHGVKPEDIVFILSQGNSRACPDAVPAMQYLSQKFPGVELKFDDEFEGMEKAVVVNLTNGSIGTSPSIIPVSLTRANSHLVMFCEDFRQILKDATDKGLAKMSKYDNPSADTDTDTGQAKISLEVLAAKDVLCSLSRKMPLQSINDLAHLWGTEDLYSELLEQEKPRFQMIDLMFKKHTEENPTLTMDQLLDNLRGVAMEEIVTKKIKDNINANIIMLKEMIMAKTLTVDEQVELAHSLGQRILFNSLTQP